MIRKTVMLACALAFSPPAHASDWEKIYTPVDFGSDLISSTVDPEVIPSTGNIEADTNMMWRRGFAPIGYTSFNTSNSKTGDAVKLAKKLKARYLTVGTSFAGSTTATLPISTPTTSTTYTRGTASATGTGGYASGTYSGTSTTYGSQTSYIPYTINRFDKGAVYFKEAPKNGVGILFYELSPEQIAQLETRRAIVVGAIRDGSPAYLADMLPGDIITIVNGQPADVANWRAAIHSSAEVTVKFMRNGTFREKAITIPPDWQG